MSLIASSVIGAGASLLGGIFGSNSEKKATDRQNEYNKPINVRARAEEGGFNPLLFVGPGVGQQTATGGTNYIGQGIANAGLALADGMDKQKMLDIEKAKLAQDQQKLDVLIQNATIRPKSGGIYAGNVTAPSAGGVGSGQKPKGTIAKGDWSGVDRISKWVIMTDPDTGLETKMLNPDWLDSGPTEMASGAAVMSAAETAQHGKPSGLYPAFADGPISRWIGGSLPQSYASAKPSDSPPVLMDTMTDSRSRKYPNKKPFIEKKGSYANGSAYDRRVNPWKYK